MFVAAIRTYERERETAQQRDKRVVSRFASRCLKRIQKFFKGRAKPKEDEQFLVNFSEQMDECIFC